jgi:DNA invertase Pin-like site-specific DNA recombinase
MEIRRHPGRLHQALASGQRLARPPDALSPAQRQLAEELRATGHTVPDIASLIGASRATLYRILPSKSTPPAGEDSPP